MKLFNLLQIKSSEDIEKIEITSEFIKHANSLINENNDSVVEKGSVSFDGIKQKDQDTLNDIKNNSEESNQSIYETPGIIIPSQNVNGKVIQKKS